MPKQGKDPLSPEKGRSLRVLSQHLGPRQSHLPKPWLLHHSAGSLRSASPPGHMPITNTSPSWDLITPAPLPLLLTAPSPPQIPLMVRRTLVHLHLCKSLPRGRNGVKRWQVHPQSSHQPRAIARSPLPALGPKTQGSPVVTHMRTPLCSWVSKCTMENLFQ